MQRTENFLVETYKQGKRINKIEELNEKIDKLEEKLNKMQQSCSGNLEESLLPSFISMFNMKTTTESTKKKQIRPPKKPLAEE
mmetsp:Transcript_4874/g.5632  ORF Transcript_4874/g.5632 Transcript_4874/m.5632 type:complete len:83 (-) Transcript_4874:129-377(-)